MMCRVRTVVLDQIFRLRLVVFLKCANEIHRGTIEGVDILVIIAHGKQAKAQIRVIQRSAGHSGDEPVGIRSDILVLVDKDPAITLDQGFTLDLGLVFTQALSLQLADRLAQNVVKVRILG